MEASHGVAVASAIATIVLHNQPLCELVASSDSYLLPPPLVSGQLWLSWAALDFWLLALGCRIQAAGGDELCHMSRILLD